MFRSEGNIVNQQHFDGVMVWGLDITRGTVYVAGVWYCYFAGFKAVDETERRASSALS